MSPTPRRLGILLLLTVAAVAIAGYHLGIEDQAIYLPGIKVHLDPTLYPHDREFFMPQVRPTLIDEIVATTVRVTHMNVDWAVFAWHLLSIYLLLLGCWRVAKRLFNTPGPRWAAVALVTALLTIPVAGTALYIADQHLHPRTLATAFILFAAAEMLPGNRRSVRLSSWAKAGFWVLMAAFVHIQMAFFGFVLLVFLVLPFERIFAWERVSMAALVVVSPLATLFQKSSPEWREAMLTRSQHFLLRWEWYEWLGVVAPIFILWWFASIGLKIGSPTLTLLCRRLSYLSLATFIGGMIITIPARFERLTPYQPMRMFHLIYVLMFLVIGGLLQHYVLRDKPWRWAVLFIPICAGMFFAQRDLFPSTRHVEWPGRSTGNAWVEAFDWVRQNTPKDAYFALDPHYISSPGEDYHGFRGLAERSQMADWDKDPGVVCLFPSAGAAWSRQVHALDKWKQFKADDLRHLHSEFGANWVILARPVSGASDPASSFDCPYRNAAVSVCTLQ